MSGRSTSLVDQPCNTYYAYADPYRLRTSIHPPIYPSIHPFRMLSYRVSSMHVPAAAVWVMKRPSSADLEPPRRLRGRLSSDPQPSQPAQQQAGRLHEQPARRVLPQPIPLAIQRPLPTVFDPRWRFFKTFGFMPSQDRVHRVYKWRREPRHLWP